MTFLSIFNLFGIGGQGQDRGFTWILQNRTWLRQISLNQFGKNPLELITNHLHYLVLELINGMGATGAGHMPKPDKTK